MSLRRKLQTNFSLLTLVTLGLAAVTLWATIQWQSSERELQEHYQRSLLLQEVRLATFRAFIEVPEELSGRDPLARQEFEMLLIEAEVDFRAWAELAYSEDEKEQVREVRQAYDVTVQHARQLFELVAAQRAAEAREIMETQIESVDFPAFEAISARAVESDNENRRYIQRSNQSVRELVRIALGIASAMTIGLVTYLGFFFNYRLLRPLREVEVGLAALGRGDLQRRIPEAAAIGSTAARAKELNILVQVFNRTVDELGHTTVSKVYLDSIIESLIDALLVTTPDGTIRSANPAASELFGVSHDEIIGCKISDFIPVGEINLHERMHDLETAIRTPQCREIPIRLSRSVMHSGQGEILGIACVAQDITQRKRAEEQIHAALEEKEVLLKETNHRVKNNLQIIDSLLSLQSRKLGDSAGRDALAESRTRIQAMALVHELLYRSDTPAHIDVGEYFRSLTEHLMDMYGTREANIRVVSAVDGIIFNLDVAIPCGLIVNELVTNSLKHGYPGGGAGEIVVEFQELLDRHYSLAVRDNGCGLPVHLRIEETRSVGLRLVRTLTEQLGGVLVVSREEGARFEVRFPLERRV